MRIILPFSDLTQTDIPAAGGKGANLGELTAVNLPVPPGFVISTVAYDAFVQTHDLQAEILAKAAAGSAADPAAAESAAAHIRDLFMRSPVPDELAAEIRRAYAELAATAVAVRSSATAEDLPEASFAGQQESFLNVQGEEALLTAVRECWAGLWTARAISYRQRQGIDPQTVSLAVIVQEMAPADVSGILFTANPLNGRRDQLLINAAWGLGEAIVGGLVTPDSIVIDKQTGQIAARETAVKTTMTALTNTGTAEIPVPAKRQEAPALEDETAVALAKIGVQIETHYGMPMDIEWALAAGRIAILQARPITSLPDFSPIDLAGVTWEPPAPHTVWMRRQIVEHMPEPLSPLFADLYLRQGLMASMDQLLDDMGEISGATFDFAAMMPHGFANTINGYAYTTSSVNMTAADLLGVLRIYANFRGFVNMRAFDWDGVALPRYQGLIARWATEDLRTVTDAELLDGIAEMATADSVYWFGSAKNLGLSRLLDPLFDKLLNSPLVRGALPAAQRNSAAFLRGFDSKALDAQADLEALAAQIRAAGPLRALVTATEADHLLDALREHDDGGPILAGIQRYLDAYGHQIYNLDFAEPTQTEDPRPILLSLRALVTHPPAQSARARQAQMAAERDALVAQTAARLAPPARALFNWVWKWTSQYAPYRENVMFYMGAAWPTLRALARELGERLTAVGTLADPDGIYYLDCEEIRRAIAARAQGAAVPEFPALVQERRALREARKRLTPQPTVPERGSLKFGPLDLSFFAPTPTDRESIGAILEGYAVSNGRVTAPASVIHSVAEFDQMQPGTILVCTTTTPAWTPLFSQAVGLVTDVGGALAHGSIVAREYGIPAVMGTGVATARIQTGMMLEVDGNRGTVTLLDEVQPEEAERRLAAQQVEKERTARQRKVILGGVIGLLVGFLWWRRKR